MINDRITNKKSIFENLQQDNIFPEVSKVEMQSLTSLPNRKGLDYGILSGGKLVNVVSKSYGLLTNEQLFLGAEEELIKNDIYYEKRSINRDNCSFAADYILNDDSFRIETKQAKKGVNDTIYPMIRIINSYDGSCKTAGYFGFFRKVCQNGLHVAQTKIGFNIKHRGNVNEAVIPHLKELVKHFISNEYYTLHKKFEELSQIPLSALSTSKSSTDQVRDFISFVADQTGLFKYEASDKNPEPSLNAKTVANTIHRESTLLGVEPTLWLGYNAFNELLHGKLKKTFDKQRQLDAQLFDTVYSLSESLN